MRSKLLVGAAILAAGAAMASAQNAPGGFGKDFSKDRRAHSALAQAPQRALSAGLPKGKRSKERSLENLQMNLQLAEKRRSALARGETSRRQQLAGEARDGALRSAGANRSMQERDSIAQTPGQSELRQIKTQLSQIKSELVRIKGGDLHAPNRSMGRQAHGKTAVLTQKQNKHRQQDRARSPAPPRLPDQAMGRANERELHSETRRGSITSHPEQHQGDALHIGRAEIRTVQAALKQQGFNVDSADGVLGQHTKKALIAFQKQRGFQPTGKIDRATFDALNASAAGAVPDGSRAGARSGQQQDTPQGVPADAGQDSTTGQGSNGFPPAASPPQQPESDQQTQDGFGVPIPVNPPQDDFRNETAPLGGEQR